MTATLYEGNKKISVAEGSKAAPKSNEVRVKIAYTGICGTDLHIFHGVMDARVGNPHIMGHECSGVIDEIGSDVEDLSVGDKVVVRPLDPCGECYACKNGLSHICYNLNFMGVDTNGSMQSYWTVPSTTIHKIPEDMDLKNAALVEPVAVATHDVNRSGLKAGEKAVIIGGGPIGILVALVAKSFGADVVISEINDFRLGFAKDLGIDTVNPMEKDLVSFVNKWTDGVGADVCFEVSGSKPGALVMTEVVKTRGKVVLVGIYGQPAEVNLKQMFLREVELIGSRVYEAVDYDMAIDLVAKGDYPFEKVITKVAPLDELQEVFNMMDTDQQQMKVLIEC